MSIVNAGIVEATSLLGSGLGGTKFDAVALGTDNTAVQATDTALGAEITTGGGQRKSGVDVTVALATDSVTDDLLRFTASWTFTGAFSVNELGVFNDAVAGDMFLRQVFDAPLDVVANDTLELQIDVISSDEVVAGDSVLTNAGLAEGNKLLGTGLTPDNGAIASIALGLDDGTVLSLAATNTQLGDEILAADGFDLARGEESSGPTVTQDDENITGDTVKVESTWVVGGTVAVREVGLFNTLTEGGGTMFMRHIFAADLNLVATDQFTMIMRHVQTG